jgi:hypothetical protein
VSDDATRYPLAWPHGWKRTPSHQRVVASFSTGWSRTEGAGEQARVVRGSRQLTVMDGIKRLTAELGRLGALHEVLSTNVETRLDGLPRSGQREPTDPGAAVYFRLKGKPRCLACDKWTRVADNIAALAQHIDALRRIERYGVGTMEQAFAGYAALPPDATADWWIVLGVRPDATDAQIEDAFRTKARSAHPDVGGRHEDMARLTAAREAAKLR